MDTEFKNEDRRRYYGLRIGDIVNALGLDAKIFFSKTEVVGFDYGDNNSVYVKGSDGEPTEWVAEWCNVITKVEDRTDFNKEGLVITDTGVLSAIKKEFILCAANYYNDGIQHTHKPTNIDKGYVICGHRHHNCIGTFAKIVGFPYSKEALELRNTEVQGFLTNTNRFVSRKEAYKIAFENDQIIGPNKGYPENEIGLTSEDLY